MRMIMRNSVIVKSGESDVYKVTEVPVIPEEQRTL